MADDSRGGNDTLIGADSATNNLYGDADEMHDSTRGGNDTLTGGDVSFSNLFGDARIMDGDSRGGNDTLNGGQGIFSAEPPPSWSMAMPSKCTTTRAAATTR